MYSSSALRSLAMKYLFLLLMVTLLGCDPPLSTKAYKSREISIVCVDRANMYKTLSERVPYDPFAPYCKSYFDAYSGVIYVPWSKDKDINGKPMPEFEELGHEMWHVVAGWWHGGAVFAPPSTNSDGPIIKVSKALPSVEKNLF